MRMDIELQENRKVAAKFKDFEIITDQPLTNGGNNSAPAPFDLFLASLGTCAGYYVKIFCMQRNIPTNNIKLIQTILPGEHKGLLGKIKLEIQVPEDFPDKYKPALINAADLCAVKRTIQNPPEFEITIQKTG